MVKLEIYFPQLPPSMHMYGFGAILKTIYPTVGFVCQTALENTGLW